VDYHTRFSQDNYSCRISWYHAWYLLTYIFSHSKRYISIHVHDLTYCNTTALHNHSEIHSMNLLFRRILDISRMHIPMYIDLFNYTSSLRNSIATRSSENIFYCENLVLLSSFPRHISRPNMLRVECQYDRVRSPLFFWIPYYSSICKDSSRIRYLRAFCISLSSVSAKSWRLSES